MLAYKLDFVGTRAVTTGLELIKQGQMPPRNKEEIKGNCKHLPSISHHDFPVNIRVKLFVKRRRRSKVR